MGSQSLASARPEGSPRPKRAVGKHTKPSNRASKRMGGASAHHDDKLNAAAGKVGHHRRVWKACERCRMKKTKCDGKFPCNRCKNDGLVCTAGVRKKMEYRQLPRGYAEVLENTQLILIATIHKLYSMVRHGQSWKLDEPSLNDRGQPVVHNIAHILGCIRPNHDVDLPPHSVFPADEPTMAELARQLEERQRYDHEPSTDIATSAITATDSYPHTNHASCSDLEHSDSEQGHCETACCSYNAAPLSPQTLASANDFDLSMTTANLDNDTLLSAPAMTLDFYSYWNSVSKAQQQPAARSMPCIQQPSSLHNPAMMDKNGLKADYSGAFRPETRSSANSVFMMGMPDRTIYAAFENEP